MKTICKTELFEKLGGMSRVTNLKSPRSRRPVANQYEVRYANGCAFQSYGTLIAVEMNGQLYLTSEHDYSRTTSKYATLWTSYTTAERRAGLKDGSFVLIEG